MSREIPIPGTDAPKSRGPLVRSSVPPQVFEELKAAVSEKFWKEVRYNGRDRAAELMAIEAGKKHAPLSHKVNLWIAGDRDLHAKMRIVLGLDQTEVE